MAITINNACLTYEYMTLINRLNSLCFSGLLMTKDVNNEIKVKRFRKFTFTS